MRLLCPSRRRGAWRCCARCVRAVVWLAVGCRMGLMPCLLVVRIDIIAEASGVARLPARAVSFLAGSQLPLALLARQARQVPTLYICIRMYMHVYALVCMCVYMHTVWQRQADAH